MNSGKPEKTDIPRLALLIFDSFMAACYCIFGVILLFGSLFKSVFRNASINDGLRIMLGILLGLYGVFRVYKAIQKIKLLKNE
jgi:predicted membrane channel-forming protein YqfA (hemolysin III family)